MPKRKRGVTEAKRVERLGYERLAVLFQLHLRWRIGELATEKGIADFVVTPPHVTPTFENSSEGLVVELKASADQRAPNFVGADKTESAEEGGEEGGRDRSSLAEAKKHADAMLFFHFNEFHFNCSCIFDKFSIFIVPLFGEKHLEFLAKKENGEERKGIYSLDVLRKKGYKEFTSRNFVSLSKELGSLYNMKNR